MLKVVKWAKINLVIFPLLLVLFAGCFGSQWKTCYKPDIQVKYPPTTEVDLVEFNSYQELQEAFKNQYAQNYIKLGHCDFRGYDEPESNLRNFARSIGADVVLHCKRFAGTETTRVVEEVPGPVEENSVTGRVGGTRNWLGEQGGVPYSQTVTNSTKSYATREYTANVNDDTTYFLRRKNH